MEQVISLKFGDVEISVLPSSNDLDFCKIVIQGLPDPYAETDFDRDTSKDPKPHDVYGLSKGVAIEFHYPRHQDEIRLCTISYANLWMLDGLFNKVVHEQAKRDYDADSIRYYDSLKHEDDNAAWGGYERRNHYNDDLDMDQQSQEHWDNS